MESPGPFALETPSHRRLFAQHAGLLISGTVVLTIALKLLLISHGSYATATAILRESGSGNVSIAILLNLMPNLIILPVGAFSRWLGEAIFGREGFIGWMGLLSSLFLLIGLTSLLSSRLAFAFATGNVVFGLWLGRGDVVRGIRQGQMSTFTKNERTSMLFLLVSTLAIILLFNDRPWLPAEEITMPGDKPLVGYVLRDQPTVSILREDDRKVLYFQDASIEKRNICQLKGQASSRPLASAWRPAKYEPCSEPP